MKNLFVDYDTALKLKELGFDEPCFGFFVYQEFRYWIKDSKHQYDDCKNSLFNRNEVSAPLYFQIFNWVKEKYNIDAWVSCYQEEEDLKIDGTYSYFIYKDKKYVTDQVDFETYKEAEIECINQLLKLIDEKI